jgi:hypothetical protein
MLSLLAREIAPVVTIEAYIPGKQQLLIGADMWIMAPGAHPGSYGHMSGGLAECPFLMAHEAEVAPLGRQAMFSSHLVRYFRGVYSWMAYRAAHSYGAMHCLPLNFIRMAHVAVFLCKTI